LAKGGTHQAACGRSSRRPNWLGNGWV
jgi:hypothetical protein